MEFILPSFDTVLGIHQIVIEEYGGLDGLPHPEYIHSAIARPQHYMTYSEECDIHLVSALILDGVARDHAFADGNKRTALLSMLMTYRMNGVRLEYGLMMNEKFESLVLKVAQRKPSVQVLRSDLEKLVKQFTQL